MTRHRSEGITSRTLVVLLCVVLMLFVGATQALHSHASNDGANPGCSLCTVAHVSALPEPSLVAPLAAQLVDSVTQAEPVSTPQRFFSFSLYVRPPPVLTAHA